LGLAVGFALLFAAPAADSQLVGAAWVLVMFVVCATAFAFFQVAFVAMPAEMTGSYDERTRLMGWRIVFLALTILVTGAGAPIVRDAVGGRDGYRVMGVVVACVIALGVLAVYHGTRSAPVGAAQAAHGGLREQLRIVARARDFRLLLMTYVVQALAVGCMLAGVDYLASDVLGRESATTVLFVAFVGPALLLTPVWTRVGERVGKKAGYLASSVVFAVGAFGVVLARTDSLAVVVVAVTLVGVGYAGCQVFPLAMLPDVAALDARRTGENRVGVYTGVWTGAETLGLAIGPGLFALGLAIGGYESSTGGGVDQGDGALLAITLGCSVVPAVLTLLSLWWLRRFTLTSHEVEEEVA
jgi:Na+/melibiose symporter-like transporter